jgi:hypothetical protein
MPASVEIEVCGGANAARREQHHVGIDLTAVFQSCDECRNRHRAFRPVSAFAVEAQDHAAIAQIVDEFRDQFADRRSRAGLAAGSITVTFTSSAEKIVAYSMPITLAPITARSAAGA